MYRDVLGFSISPFMQRVMNIHGFFGSIMRTGKKSEDSSNKLPPGVPIPVLPVDYLKVRPDSWIGGEGAYVVPVDSDWGLWFNFTMNNPFNTAVLPSIKGMNPLTGQRVSGYDLEEYQDKCPVHNKPFSKGNLCTECGFKWPYQNYLAHPGKLWVDGFRTPDGNVRQFYFTEEMAKSIPELVIGKEDTVPAFGFCFYKLKEYDGHFEEGKYVKNEFPINPRSQYSSYCGGSIGIGTSCASSMFYSPSLSTDFLAKPADMASRSARYRKGLAGPRKFSTGGSMLHISGVSLDSVSFKTDLADADSSTKASYLSASNTASIESASNGTTLNFSSSADGGASYENTLIGDDEKGTDILREYESPLRKSAEVGIGAGAKIKQAFAKSSKSLEDWEKKPAGVIRLYFVFQEEFERYAAAGFNNLEGNETGYLEGLPVGGSHE
jgi:hypothetical protein